MLPLVFTNPWAESVYIAACIVWLLPEMMGMSRQMAKVSRKTASVLDHSSRRVLIGLQWVGVALNFSLAWLLPAAAITWQRWAIFMLAILFIFLGVALRRYSIRVLGQYFTRDVAVSVDQQVIQQGPYRVIRHPAYSGTFLTMLGVGLGLANWASLASLLICVFLGHLYRVHIEEQALIVTLGEPYLEYMRSTRRFIPWVF